MASVFLINSKGNAVLRPEAVKLTEYLQQMKTDVLLYIILSQDYTYGPFHRKPPQDRALLAERRVWQNRKAPEFSKIKFFNEAVEEYQSLIFDINRYNRDTYLRKIADLNRQLIDTDDPDKMKKILSAANLLEDKLEEIDRKVNQDDEVFELAGDKTSSLIEVFIRRRKEFAQSLS